MLITHRTYIAEDTKMAGLIMENPRLLLLLENLNIDFSVSDKSVSQLCAENSVPLPLFLLLGNLYNGFHPDSHMIGSVEDILVIIRFLQNSHNNYKTEKYPEILGLIKEIQNSTGNEEVKLIEVFFRDYFNEVLEHLDYEDEIAFPFFVKLTGETGREAGNQFSVQEYLDHHTDIETKLADLKNLLVKHIRISNELTLRRKLFLSLIELEQDLQIHALIEEKILLPLIMEIEKNRLNG
jgi:regulator of cell morphogenesis and NO signaling